MPLDAFQCLADLLPTFRDRLQLRAACRSSHHLEWRLAPPLELGARAGDWSGMRLGDLGARAVAAALAGPHNALLGRLYLGGNGIGDDGAVALAAALRAGGRPVALKGLHLDGNNIGDIGAGALAGALGPQQTLHELDLWGNRLSEAGRRALRGATDWPGVSFLDLHQPASGYMSDVQQNISTMMRAILFDWLVDVFNHLRCPWRAHWQGEGVVFLTFCYIDRYLSLTKVARTTLQLVGVACALLAVGNQKNGSVGAGAITAPSESAEWLAYITDNAYSTEQVLDMAHTVRETLDFELDQPTVHTFVLRYLRATGWTYDSFHLTLYLIELAALDYGLLRYSPQAIAAAATVLSHRTLGWGAHSGARGGWERDLLRCARVSIQNELAPCACVLARLHTFAPSGRRLRSKRDVGLVGRFLLKVRAGVWGLGNAPASYRKYSTPYFNAVSEIRPPGPPRLEELARQLQAAIDA